MLHLVERREVSYNLLDKKMCMVLQNLHIVPVREALPCQEPHWVHTTAIGTHYFQYYGARAWLRSSPTLAWLLNSMTVVLDLLRVHEMKVSMCPARISDAISIPSFSYDINHCLKKARFFPHPNVAISLTLLTDRNCTHHVTIHYRYCCYSIAFVDLCCTKRS